MDSILSNFFKARGVALVGASGSPNKLSYGILRNMLQYGYKGGVYPVNPRYNEILGVRCYPDIASVPDPVDLAVIIVPAGNTPQMISECGLRGIKAAIVISGGFKEVGAEGQELENEVLRIARGYGMRIIGPNCVGTLDLNSGLNSTFIQGLPSKGRIGFISQSGALGGGVIDYIADKRVGFSMFASLGNEADVTETDLLEYLANDPDTAVIAIYVEAIRDGVRFMDVARQVTRHKPVVLLKAGRTSAGARAVSSHTGSLAGSNTAYRAAFEQSGVIEAHTINELFEIAVALDFQPLPRGKRTVILTNSGGPAALASDSLASNGMELHNLTPQTRENLRPLLNPSAQVGNPVDMLGGAEPKEYSAALELLLKDENVDAVLAILVPQALVNPAQVATVLGERAAAQSEPRKPVIACFMGERSIGEARVVLQEMQIPMYVFPEATGRVLGAMQRYAAWLASPSDASSGPVNLDRLAARIGLDHGRVCKTMGEAETRPILQAYGVPLVEARMARTVDEATAAAEDLGYPVALKVVSPEILHKSDVGGIRLGLSNAEAVRKGFLEMYSQIASSVPSARIEGALVERMAPKGVEVIVGMKRDPNFGPLIMFGMGGVTVELYGDVAFRIAPIGRKDALEMIHSIKGSRLLTGFRDTPPADVDALVDIILRMSQLSMDFPEIDEMEINPLRVFPAGQGVLALDCRLICG